MQQLSAVEQRVMRLLQLGHHPVAYQQVMLALESDDDNGRLWQLAGLVHRHRCEYRAAIETLERASVLVPLSVEAQIALAESYTRCGSPEVSRAIAQHLATAGRIPPELLPRLAGVLQAAGEHELALKACREVVRREPTNHGALFDMGRHMLKLGIDARKAVSVVQRAWELARDNLRYRVTLAWLLVRVERRERAQRLVRGLLVDEVESPALLRMLLVVYIALGDSLGMIACRRQIEGVSQRW